MSTNRDTQFAGFAHALIWKLAKTGFTDIEQDELTIARAGYDLVMHAFETVDSSIYKRWLSGENIPLFDALVDTIPDMAELPEEQER